MEKLSLAQLRMILRAMSPHELEDMVCALYRSSGEAAAFFNRCYNTEEYVERLVDTYKAKLQIQFSCMGSCGSLAAARRSLNEFTRAVFEPRAALEMMLYCLEKATKWAGDGEIPVSACENMVEIFREFVERLNQLNSPDVFSDFRKRLEQLEWDAGAVGWGYGEAVSELCLDILWWGGDGQE